MTLSHPSITTDRLVLRPPQATDWPAYLAYRRSPRSTLPKEGGTAIAWTHFAALFGHWLLRGFGRFVMTDRRDGSPLGHAGLSAPEGWPEPEVTWTLWSGEHEGCGLATEAARASIDHAFNDLGWTSAVSYIDPKNTRSIAVAERLGARLDSTAPSPEGFDLLVYRHRKPEVRQ